MKRISAGTLSLIADFIGVVLILFLLSAAAYWFIQRPVFLLKNIDVQIEGNQEAITAPEVVAALKGNLSGTYFTTDLEKAAAALKKMPWVRDVAVSREWPNRLQIELILHKPIAVWGEDRLLAEDGAIFVANPEIAESSGSLPRINGPQAQRMRIYEQYRTFEKVCSENGYQMVSLDLADFGGWVLRLRRPEGKVLKLTFPENDTSEVMVQKLKEIIRALPKIQDRIGGEPLELDARYAKGIAVVKPQPETEAEAGEPLPGESKDGR